MPVSNARYAWPVLGLVIGGSGVYVLSKQTGSSASSTQVPSLRQVSSVDDISVESPIRPLTLEAANASLREDVHTFVFEGNNGVSGRVDVVRVSSNSKTEDDWDLKIAKGVDGTGMLYAGVYDGHA